MVDIGCRQQDERYIYMQKEVERYRRIQNVTHCIGGYEWHVQMSDVGHEFVCTGTSSQ
jgi:hypothetical protein